MARAAQDKQYNSFAGGFVTEATGLSFPENSARDIDNCDIELSGKVRRRLGLNEEAGGYAMGVGMLVDQTPHGLSGPFSVEPSVGEACTKEELAVSAHTWQHPGGNTSLYFIVFQIGNTIFVQNWDNTVVSDPAAIYEHVTGATAFALDDVSTGFVYNTSHLASAKVPLQSSVGFGRIWFTSSALVPFYMEYDSTLKTLAVRPVGYDSAHPNGSLSIRDFNGVDDGLSADEQPVSLSDEHKYNLMNQGWSANYWDQYKGTIGKYPSNAQQWILGRTSEQNFDQALFAKQDFGNSLAPRGRAIIDALSGDRDSVFDFSFTPIDTYDEKALSSFTTCAVYAGRLWIAGDGNPKRPNGVYFSKIIQKTADAGVLRSENDPTSEHFFDLLATDGGVIYLTEAAGIQRLVPFGAGVLVMATNGVWFIYGGGQTGFTATSFSVEKVSSTGILSASSVVSTDQQVAFFAENSIHVLALPDQGVIPVLLDIAQNKIFSYYAAIPREARVNAHAAFDTISKKIFWSWLDLEEYDYPAHKNAYNKMLILDTRTGAYTKYSFTCGEGVFFFNGPVFPKRTITRPKTLAQVVVEGQGAVVLANGDDVAVFVDADPSTEFLNSVKVVVLDGVTGGLRITEFYDIGFLDYRTMPSYTAQDFVSYLVTGDETLGDIQRNKMATYLHSFFQRTENGMEVDTLGSLGFKNPSGCSVRARWDWHNTPTGGRWSNPQVAYRYRRPFQPEDVNDPVDTGDEMVYTKLKVRGHGRSLSLHYESEPGKDFQLLGYSVAFTANGV